MRTRKVIDYGVDLEEEEEEDKTKKHTPPRPRRVLRKRAEKRNYNEAREEWNDLCFVCGEYGDIICCDTCTNAAHLSCVGLKSVPDGMWQCESCLLKFNTTR